MYEKGKISFVSFVRAYSKHECAHIFQVKELDLIKLGKGFGLLHLPKMPEIGKQKHQETIPFYDIDVSTIKYKNKEKEKQRIENSQKPKVKNKKLEKNKPWSNRKELKLKKEIRKKKKDLTDKKRKFSVLTEEDLQELNQDFKLLKKFKKNKNTDEISE